MGIKYQTERVWVKLTSFLRHVFIANKCKHKTKLKGEIHFFNHTSIMKMPLNKNGRPDYCLKCIAEMTIQCAWCKNPITIGSPITLYIPKKDFEIPEHAVRYTENNSKALVGCLGWDCADTGADICGHWMPPGEVERCPSPLEMCLMANQDEDGNMIIVNDTHDYPNSVSVHKFDSSY